MEKITVLEKGQKLEFSFEDLLKYHGVGYPGGVAHAFQVMQRAFPQLDDGKLLPEAAGILESPHGRYYFRFSYRGKTVVVTIRPGFVRQDFIEMARKPNRTEEEEVILAQMKRDMAKRLLEAKPEEVYDAVIL